MEPGWALLVLGLAIQAFCTVLVRTAPV